MLIFNSLSGLSRYWNGVTQDKDGDLNKENNEFKL